GDVAADDLRAAGDSAVVPGCAWRSVAYPDRPEAWRRQRGIRRTVEAEADSDRPVAEDQDGARESQGGRPGSAGSAFHELPGGNGIDAGGGVYRLFDIEHWSNGASADAGHAAGGGGTAVADCRVGGSGRSAAGGGRGGNRGTAWVPVGAHSGDVAAAVLWGGGWGWRRGVCALGGWGVGSRAFHRTGSDGG